MNINRSAEDTFTVHFKIVGFHTRGERQTDRLTDRQIERLTQTDRHNYRQAVRQTQTETQTDREKDTGCLSGKERERGRSGAEREKERGSITCDKQKEKGTHRQHKDTNEAKTHRAPLSSSTSPPPPPTPFFLFFFILLRFGCGQSDQSFEESSPSETDRIELTRATRGVQKVDMSSPSTSPPLPSPPHLLPPPLPWGW